MDYERLPVILKRYSFIEKMRVLQYYSKHLNLLVLLLLPQIVHLNSLFLLQFCYILLSLMHLI